MLANGWRTKRFYRKASSKRACIARFSLRVSTNSKMKTKRAKARPQTIIGLKKPLCPGLTCSKVIPPSRKAVEIPEKDRANAQTHYDKTYLDAKDKHGSCNGVRTLEELGLPPPEHSVVDPSSIRIRKSDYEPLPHSRRKPPRPHHLSSCESLAATLH